MKIGFISDTHGSLTAWSKAVNGPLAECDLIVHSGDVLYHGPRNNIPHEYAPRDLAEAINRHPCSVIIARGNCDADVDGLLIEWPLLSPYAFIHHDGIRIMAVHDLAPDAVEPAIQRYRLDLLVTGHTHVSRLQRAGRGVWLNPGSPAIPKDGRASVAVLEEGAIRVMDLSGGVAQEYLIGV